jgi:hypothetical protein
MMKAHAKLVFVRANKPSALNMNVEMELSMEMKSAISDNKILLVMYASRTGVRIGVKYNLGGRVLINVKSNGGSVMIFTRMNQVESGSMIIVLNIQRVHRILFCPCDCQTLPSIMPQFNVLEHVLVKTRLVYPVTSSNIHTRMHRCPAIACG